MAIRLYDSAWVLLSVSSAPFQVHKDPSNPGKFLVDEFSYDVDGRSYYRGDSNPAIEQVLNLELARQFGLSSGFPADFAGYY